jgi:hypothetical protein
MGFGLADSGARGQMVANMAETLLRSMGGGVVELQVPGPASSEVIAELGLAPRPLQPITFTPVVARAITPSSDGLRRFEIVLPAAQVDSAAQRNGVSSGVALIASASAILVQGTAMTIEKISADNYGDTPYLYRVMVKES